MSFSSEYNASRVTEVFEHLKTYFNIDHVIPERKSYIVDTVRKYGYLPYSYRKAQDEISSAEVLLGLEEKFKLSGIYENNKFTFENDKISPVTRAGFTDSTWLCKEQLNIKLINLAALGNGNKDQSITGKFEDWLKQLLILPAGRSDFRILNTVVYLVPFHPRDFGCAYLPRSKFISKNLEDTKITSELGLNLSEQVKLFLAFCQLAGHPTMYDVLPQTGRYSKTVLANPYVARWFDIPELNRCLKQNLLEITENLKDQENKESIEEIRDILISSLEGESENVSVDSSYLEEKMETHLDHYRKKYSKEMTSKEYQQQLAQTVKKLVNKELGLPEDHDIKEEDIGDKHDMIIGKLIQNGLWPSPGGAWCSSGIPVYKRMVSGGGFPLFDHFDVDGRDVTYMANLDCQTPFYFVYLESGEYNQPVIDFWGDFLTDLQEEYNFDAFRVDHVDHIVDRVSQTKDGRPISYRTPAKVLGEVIRRLRRNKPHFGLLAEYMLWERFYKEYHQDMGFDLLWGSDIVSQHLKNVKTIIDENHELKSYNEQFGSSQTFLSIVKAYNNQDGEFREIDQYPGQMGVEGALLKWFKFKFLPFCPSAERPVMYIDGDESFTTNGVECVIGSETSLKRNDNDEFFRAFDAINRFALNNIFTRYGIVEIHHSSEPKHDLIVWTIKKLPEFGDNERLLIVANEKPPFEVDRILDVYNQLMSIKREYDPIKNACITIPEGFIPVSEYILPDSATDYVESTDIKHYRDCCLVYEELKPSEFHIYKIVRPE